MRGKYKLLPLYSIPLAPSIYRELSKLTIQLLKTESGQIMSVVLGLSSGSVFFEPSTADAPEKRNWQQSLGAFQLKHEVTKVLIISIKK